MEEYRGRKKCLFKLEGNGIEIKNKRIILLYMWKEVIINEEISRNLKRLVKKDKKSWTKVNIIIYIYNNW